MNRSGTSVLLLPCFLVSVMMIDPYFNDDGECLWSVDIQGAPVGFTLSPTISENGVIIISVMQGNIYTFNSKNGEFLIENGLGDEYKIMNTDGYSTSNSACVNGNRVYILGHKFLSPSKLFALDVNPNGMLTPKWNYPYVGKSQSSPTFIDGTIYFDNYTLFNSGILAIIDGGSDYSYKWYHPSDHQIWFTMTADPRGDSIWYEDAQNKKLDRLWLDNGTLRETIHIDDIMGSDDYKPISVMQICDSSNPKLIISANDPGTACYVICIDLENQKSLMWKYKIESLLNRNYAGGQYTILLNATGYNPRIVFNAYLGGVYGLGQ